MWLVPSLALRHLHHLESQTEKCQRLRNRLDKLHSFLNMDGENPEMADMAVSDSSGISGMSEGEEEYKVWLRVCNMQCCSALWDALFDRNKSRDVFERPPRSASVPNYCAHWRSVDEPDFR